MFYDKTYRTIMLTVRLQLKALSFCFSSCTVYAISQCKHLSVKKIRDDTWVIYCTILALNFKIVIHLVTIAYTILEGSRAVV